MGKRRASSVFGTTVRRRDLPPESAQIRPTCGATGARLARTRAGAKTLSRHGHEFRPGAAPQISEVAYARPPSMRPPRVSAEAPPVSGDPSIRPLRGSRKPRRERGECPAAWKKPHEGRHNGATRVDAPVRHHQVPGGHLSLLSHALEKYVGFQILEGNWPQPVVPVPGKKLADRPAAEVALSVVEDDCGGCHGAGT
jgi:hypothetical protein